MRIIPVEIFHPCAVSSLEFVNLQKEDTKLVIDEQMLHRNEEIAGARGQ
jgi:hypothetical protein